MGGTIDKEYVADTASLEVLHSFVSWVEPDLGLTYRLDVTQLAKKDSLDLADSDRTGLLTYLAANDDPRLLVTHGTDTLLSTASDVWAAQQARKIAPDKTVVFTGAFRPGRFAQAEASFNVGYALAVAQTAPPGVYVAVGGDFAPVEKVSHRQGHFVYG